MRERFGCGGKNALVVAGQRQPLEVHLLAYAINSALGAIGNTVTLIPANQENSAADLKILANPQRYTLVILGGNPAYNLNWSPKAKTVVRLGYYEDETAEKSNGIFRRRIISNLGAMRRRAMERCSDSAVDSTAVWRI
jgi:hypothetical protein